MLNIMCISYFFFLYENVENIPELKGFLPAQKWLDPEQTMDVIFLPAHVPKLSGN